MEHKTYKPDTELSTFIKSYWTLNIPREIPKGRQQIISDGCMDIIFNLGDPVNRILSDNSSLLQPSAFVMGQITKPMWVEPSGLVDTFGITFFPGSFAYFTNISMAELSDKDTELSLIFGEIKSAEIEHKIRVAKNTQEKISIVNQFLFDILENTTNIPSLVDSIINKILHKNGTESIKEILKENTGKRRQLERDFSNYVGTSPKKLCKAIRFHKALQSLLNTNKNLGIISHENEYFDQSHFTKDFKEFTGINPKDFYSSENFTLSTLLYSQ